MLRLDRKRRAGRYLEWKVRIFAAGAVLGLAGILLDEAWLRIAAIAVLAVGFLLRLLPGGTGSAEVGDDVPDRGHEGEGAQEDGHRDDRDDDHRGGHETRHEARRESDHEGRQTRA